MAWPANMTTIEVTGKFINYPDGVPATGSVAFVNTQWLRSPGVDTFVPPFSAEAVLDGTGYFSIELPATDDPDWTPLGWQYSVMINVAGKQLSGSLTLAYDGPLTVDLSDVMGSGVPAAGETYMPLSLRGAPGGVASLDGTGAVPLSQIPTLPISAVEDLDTQLSGKQPAGEYLVAEDITNLVSSETLTETAGDLVSKVTATPQAVASDLTVNGTLKVGTSGTLLIGADTNLYRVGADKLATDDALDVGGALRTYAGLQVDGAVSGAGFNVLARRPGAMRSGSRYAPVFMNYAPATIALNEIRHVPIDFYSACTIVELAVEVTAAITNARVRIIVSASDDNGRPAGDHLYVSGQLVASAVGKVGTGVIALAIPGPGRYFFAAHPQIAVPTMRSIAQVPAMFEQATMATYVRCCYSQYGVSGVPVTVGPISVDAGDAPRVECLIG